MSRIPNITDSIRLGEMKIALESLSSSIELQMPPAWILEAIVEGAYKDLPKNEVRESNELVSIATALECLDNAKTHFEQVGMSYLHRSIRLLLTEAKENTSEIEKTTYVHEN